MVPGALRTVRRGVGYKGVRDTVRGQRRGGRCRAGGSGLGASAGRLARGGGAGRGTETPPPGGRPGRGFPRSLQKPGAGRRRGSARLMLGDV